MFKKLLTIILNRSKVGALEYVMNILIGTLHEFQRANSQGEYDVARKPSDSFTAPTQDINAMPVVKNTAGFFENFIK